MEKCSDNGHLAEAIIAFDTLYTTNHMQMLKLLFPYLDMEQQHKLAVFIKWQELQYTMNFIGNYWDSCLKTKNCEKKKLDFSSLLPLLSPYCSEKEKELLSQFCHMQSMMSNVQDMLQYLPMLQEMMGAFSSPGEGEEFNKESTGSSGFPGANGMMDMLKSMLSAEQQGMLSLFMEGGVP